MPLEGTTTIEGLNTAWPLDGDGVSEGDDHLRQEKNVLKNIFPGTGGNGFSIPVVSTEAELNKLFGYTGDIPEVDTVQSWTKQQNFTEAALTDAVNISWDADIAQTCSVTLGGNRTLDNPTNLKAGATYILRIVQDGAGNRALSYGSAYKWYLGVEPILTLAGLSVDILSFYCDGTNMYGTILQDMK